MAKNCCICKKAIDAENAAILAMGAYGSPKCVCEECEKNIEAATRSKDADVAAEAIRNLGEALTVGNTGDPQCNSSNQWVFIVQDHCCVNIS